MWRGGDAVSHRDSDQVPLEQGSSARLSHAFGEEEPSGQVLLNGRCPISCLDSMPFIALVYSSLSFQKVPGFAFLLHHSAGLAALQTMLILVCTLLADHFYVEFKWH